MKFSILDLLGFGAFFVTGAGIGIAVALRSIDIGEPAIVAVCQGAFLGGVGAWFVFFSGLRLLAFAGIIKKPQLPLNYSAPAPNPTKVYKD